MFPYARRVRTRNSTVQTLVGLTFVLPDVLTLVLTVMGKFPPLPGYGVTAGFLGLTLWMVLTRADLFGINAPED
jgi:hypothetical protein